MSKIEIINGITREREGSMANIITSCRILCSLILLFCPAFSSVFYAFYLIAGFTDMIDGMVARKTNTVSEFGSKLDTVTDFIFVMVCLIKFMPILNTTGWLWIWIGMIAIIKGMNVISGFIVHKKFVVEHTVMNKVAGLLLFVLPLTVTFVDFKYSVIVVCTVAMFAAIQEGHFIRSHKEENI